MRLLLALMLALSPLLSENARFIPPPPPSAEKLDALFYSLNPTSLSQLLAFYKLYPETSRGQQAQELAWKLLTKHNPHPPKTPLALTLPELELDTLIRHVTKRAGDEDITLEPQTLALIETLASFFPNRNLKGFGITDKEQIINLPSEEIDLARALFLFDNMTGEKLSQYEASIDLMALQILATLPLDASSVEKVRAISHFIFYEQGFRFPPHSLYADDIDLYTFLPSVLDSRQGVCLGVSILYLCLAQRLGVHLEIITPPGHIYVRFPEKSLNIETTARGIHLDDEVYLGINTRKLQQRTMKEVVGLAFINQAAAYWFRKERAKVISLYEKASLFLPDDMHLKTLLAYNLILDGQNERAGSLLKEVKGIPFDDVVAPERIPVDYLEGRVDAEGLEAVFETVDETRSSIETKQQQLHGILKKWPRFRDGWFHLAVTYLQLGRTKEAYESLHAYHQLDPANPTVEYYLAILSLKRMDYPSAAKFFRNCLSITQKREHHPKALKQLQRQIRALYPE